MEVGLIGSCTNSSYQDLSRAASLARQVKEKNLKVASPLIVNPGSEQIRATAERDGMIAAFEDIGATIMANACGPCIGQWKRHTDDPERKIPSSPLLTVILPNVPTAIPILLLMWLLPKLPWR